MTRRTAGGSVANDFSMKTLMPFSTAYSSCCGRQPHSRKHRHVTRTQAVDGLTIGIEADEPPLGGDVDLNGILLAQGGMERGQPIGEQIGHHG